jgi:hypothetical protein
MECSKDAELIRDRKCIIFNCGRRAQGEGRDLEATIKNFFAWQIRLKVHLQLSPISVYGTLLLNND